MASSSRGESPAVAAEEQREWAELPREVTASIVSRLVATEILRSAQFVCKSWLEACGDPLVWRRINMYDIAVPAAPVDLALDRLCRGAVDRSRGQLVDIGISYFGNDYLLSYITQRCTRIKRLRLASCPYLSDKALIDAAAKLPLLEALELTLCSFSVKPLEAVGRTCPRLKSLKLNCLTSTAAYNAIYEDNVDDNGEAIAIAENMPEDDVDDNGEAIAIAENMPGLRHLQLIGNPMTNFGLQAILTGCPYLESLDLRQCPYIYLVGKLAERCAELKCLRLPKESTKDCEFYVGPDEVDLSEICQLDFLSDGSYPEVDDDYDYLSYSSGIDTSDDSNWRFTDPEDYYTYL